VFVQFSVIVLVEEAQDVQGVLRVKSVRSLRVL
jgi:hypothetical protein